MNIRLRVFLAGDVGMVVAFGIVELVHGLYRPVPSVLAAVAQRIIELTPGGFATKAVETLGKADVLTLIAFVVIATLALAGLLAYLGLRSLAIAFTGVGVLAGALSSLRSPNRTSTSPPRYLPSWGRSASVAPLPASCCTPPDFGSYPDPRNQTTGGSPGA